MIKLRGDKPSLKTSINFLLERPMCFTSHLRKQGTATQKGVGTKMESSKALVNSPCISGYLCNLQSSPPQLLPGPNSTYCESIVFSGGWEKKIHLGSENRVKTI